MKQTAKRECQQVALLMLLTLTAFSCQCQKSPFVAAGTVLFAAAPAGSSQVLNGTRTQLTVDFGATSTSQSALSKTSIRIANLSASTVHIIKLNPSPGFPDLTFKIHISVVAQSIGPGETASFDVGFSPAETISYQSSFQIISDSDPPSGPLEVTLKGRGFASSCTISPTNQLDMGFVRVGSQRTHPITIGNTSDADWFFTAQGFINTDASLFSVTKLNQAISVPAHQSVQVDVTFSPTAVGSFFASLQFISDGGCAPEPFNVLGQGVTSFVQVSPDPLDLGFADPALPWGLVSRMLTVTNLDVNLNTVSAQLCESTIGCMPSSEFAFSANGFTQDWDAGEIAPGASVELAVFFRPTALGDRSGVIVFSSSIPDQPSQIVSLHGVGGGPLVRVTPRQLSFPLAAVGISQHKSIHVENVGSSDESRPESFLSINLESPQSIVGAEDAFAGSLSTAVAGAPVLLGPGESTDIIVSYLDEIAESSSAKMIISTNDPSAKQVELLLDGSAQTYSPCTFAIRPSVLDFGRLEAESESSNQLRIINTGSTTCLFSNLEFGPGTSGAYSLPNGTIQAIELNPGATLKVPITMHPSAPTPGLATQLTGSFTFSATDMMGPASLPLLGSTGATCPVSGPLHAYFGKVSSGCTSGKLTVFTHDFCVDPIEVVGVRLADPGGLVGGTAGCDAGGDCPSFLLTDLPYDGGFTINHKESESFSVSVAYHPHGGETEFGTLLIDTRGDGGDLQPIAIQLQGEPSSSVTQSDEFDIVPTKADVLISQEFANYSSPDAGTSDEDIQRVIGDVIADAQDAGIDLHLAMLVNIDSGIALSSNADLGALIGDSADPKVLSGSVPDWRSHYLNKSQYLFSHRPEANIELYFHAAWRGMKPESLSGPNTGFLRDDAELRMIVFSENCEASPYYLAAPTMGAFESWPTDAYLHALWNIKGFNHRDLLTLSGAVNDCPACACASIPRFHEMIEDTGGVESASVPLDSSAGLSLATKLKAIRTAFFARRNRFQLGSIAIPSAGFTVRVGGVAIPPNDAQGNVVWTFSDDSNAIVFTPDFVPLIGAHLSVEYTTACN